MICIKRDVTDPVAAPLLMAKGFQTNADGSTSILMPDGTTAYQEPFQPGVFGFSPDPIGAYQACKVDGQLVTFNTTYKTPEGKVDPPYTYSWVTVPNT